MKEQSNKITSKPAGRPKSGLTRKGRNTRAALMKTARQVFADQGFYGASVSEISRRAGLSQGTFYQYFKNKEQVFQELNDEILDAFWDRASVLPQEGDFDDRMRQMLNLLFDHCQSNHYFHRILGEFELIDPVTIGYFASLSRYFRSFFRREAADGHIRFLDPNLLAYGLIGSAIFHALDWGRDAETFSREELVKLTADFLKRGISGESPWKEPADLAVSRAGGKVANKPAIEELTQGQATRRAIFQAAEEVFGRFGFNRAGISEITRAAGVAQGTFYIHFKSKRHLMEEFVKYLSREMRFALKQGIEGTTDRREAEREGLLAFFRFLRDHRQIYRVVAESETMGAGMAMWYYRRLHERYLPGLVESIEKGEIRSFPPNFLVRTLMGFHHQIGLKYLVWNSSPQAEMPKQLVEDAVNFVLNGLVP